MKLHVSEPNSQLSKDISLSLAIKVNIVVLVSFRRLNYLPLIALIYDSSSFQFYSSGVSAPPITFHAIKLFTNWYPTTTLNTCKLSLQYKIRLTNNPYYIVAPLYNPSWTLITVILSSHCHHLEVNLVINMTSQTHYTNQIQRTNSLLYVLSY